MHERRAARGCRRDLELALRRTRSDRWNHRLLAGVCATTVATALAAAGSAAAADPILGTLVGTTRSVGEVTLTREGKPVSTLKAGRYVFAIVDSTPHNGFLLDRPSGATIKLTTREFVGARRVALVLTPGRWEFRGYAGNSHPLVVRA
jgi:hypothetical protein